MSSTDAKTALRDRIAALDPSQRAAFRRKLEERGIDWNDVAPSGSTAENQAVSNDRPLTSAQRHFWIQQSLDPQSSAYHVAYRWHFDGPLNPGALEKAFLALVERHEPLRTSFPAIDGVPRRELDAGNRFTLEFVDLESEPERLETEARRAAAEPFDMERGPLLRARLFQLGKEKHLLAITLHHIIADGWSRGVIMRELTLAYRAFVAGKQPHFAPLSRSFGDFALAERDYLDSEKFLRQRRFWAEQLAGLPEIELPSDRSRHASANLDSATFQHVLAPELSAQIDALASRLKTTPFIVVAAAFKLLIHRYSGQDDLHLSVPVAGRQEADSAALVGLFTNTLVLRSAFSAGQSFESWLVHVQDRFFDALDHQEFPFPMLAEAAGLERSVRESPLTQIMFQVQGAGYREQNAEDIDFGVSGLRVRQDPAPLRQTKVDLSWYVMGRESGYAFHIEYRTALFDAWRMEAMARHFDNLLQSVCSDPQAPVETLDYLSGDERRNLVAVAGQDPIPLPDTTVDVAISKMARRYPDQVAIRCDGEDWTYERMEAAATKLAQALKRMPEPVQAGDCVAVSLPGKAYSIVSFLALLKIGAIYLPLDPAHPAERTAYVLERAGAAVILTDDAGMSAVHRCIDPADLVASNSDIGTITWPDPDPSRIAYLLFTSGSTGRPNGVPITQENLLNHLLAMRRCTSVQPGSRMLAITTPTFDISILEILLPLIVGGTVVLFGPELLLAPARLIDVMREERVTHAQATPAYWRMLLDAGWQGDRELIALCGGEALDPALAERLLETTGELWNVYGPTEATIWASALRIQPNHTKQNAIPIGGALANTELFVLDLYGEPVPYGVPGELFIGGACLSPGYWKNPALTAARFVPDPFGADEYRGSRLYKTGDKVVRRSEEEIAFIGRTDFQVKLRGHRIETGEIESRLLAEDGVEQAIVTLDAANERLVAYLCVGTGDLEDRPETERRLRRAMQRQLPRYMVPTAFVLLSEFPLNPSGKVDRRRLPAPETEKETADRVVVAPRNAIEETLLAIWTDILRREDIGVEDNFFDLGGDSITGVRISARAQAKGLRLTPMQIFEHQSISAQALLFADTLSSRTILSPWQRFALQADRSPWLITLPFAHSSAVAADAIRALENHHPALRDRLLEMPGDPTEADRETLIEWANGALSPSEPPGWAAGLFLHHGEQVLVLAAHHALLDTPSLRWLAEDAREAARRIAAGGEAYLPSAGDYIAWQADASTVPPGKATPGDNPERGPASPLSDCYTVSLEPTAFERLSASARGNSNSAEHLILCELAKVLRTDATSIDVLTSRRPTAPLKRTLGNFTRMVPVALTDPEISDPAKIGAYLTRQIATSGAGHDPATSAPGSLLFVWNESPDTGISLLHAPDPLLPSGHDLALIADFTANGLTLRWRYDRSRHSELSVERLSHALVAAIESIQSDESGSTAKTDRLMQKLKARSA
ncbi:amino acid adenylation domain-containing protein [Fulvimarina sp. MAC8]|uniref:non-ribosomal peptide synthetase n=1 Tax=Fulvimarina sp. MAC8 TaxID=3162874 RepID=UPI0032EB97D7